MKTKKIFSFVLALWMAVMLLPMQAFAANGSGIAEDTPEEPSLADPRTIPESELSRTGPDTDDQTPPPPTDIYAPMQPGTTGDPYTLTLTGLTGYETVTVNGTDVTPDKAGSITVLSGQRVAITPKPAYRMLDFQAVRENAPSTATVILEAHDVWGDGSGYQMLLDADAAAYGTRIPKSGALNKKGDADAELYAAFEYRIPENADGSLDTANIILDGSGSIEIAPGAYDWCITNPTPGDRIWIASELGNVGGRQNDYVFESGKIYRFIVGKSGSKDSVDLVIGGFVVEPEDGGYSFVMPDDNVSASWQIDYRRTYSANFWDFDSDSLLEEWQSVDADGDGETWYVSRGTSCSSPQAMKSNSYNYRPLTPDNWWFSPLVKIPEKGALLTFRVCVYPSFPENLGVFIGAGPDDLDSMEQLGTDITVRHDDWREYTIDLGAYAGQYKRIAFRHYHVTKQYYILLDDVGITGAFEGGLAVANTVSSSVSADEDKAFLFTVTLDDTNINGAYGEMLFENGAAAFSLRGGETKTAKDLPAGLGYTVTQTAADGFTTTADGDIGTIEAGRTAEAGFTNTKDVYTVTFYDEDGITVLDQQMLAFGETPVYMGRMPTKMNTVNYIYTFIGWTPKLTAVTGDAAYTAVFAKTYTGGIYNDPMPPKPAQPPEEQKPRLPFADVFPTDGFCGSVEFVYFNNLMNGVSDTAFDPYGTLTRGMLVTILYRMEGSPAIAYSGKFPDVSADQWFINGVEWVAANGIVYGYAEGGFGPDDPITREQLAAILYRYAGFKGYAVEGAAEALDFDKVSPYAADPVRWALEGGILLTDDGRVRPTEKAKRWEIAAAIEAFLGNAAQK